MLARTVGPSLARTFTEAMPSGGGAKVAVGACAVAAVAAIAFKALR